MPPGQQVPPAPPPDSARAICRARRLAQPTRLSVNGTMAQPTAVKCHSSGFRCVIVMWLMCVSVTDTRSLAHLSRDTYALTYAFPSAHKMLPHAFYLPRDAMHTRGICRHAVSVRPSVCLSRSWIMS